MKSDEKLNRIVGDAVRARVLRDQDYRAQSLRIHPWVCARCGREFTQKNLPELTVHHKDHNHDNNPPDGSNWENLCIYCHDNEHAKFLNQSSEVEKNDADYARVTHKPLNNLRHLLQAEHSDKK